MFQRYSAGVPQKSSYGKLDPNIQYGNFDFRLHIRNKRIPSCERGLQFNDLIVFFDINQIVLIGFEAPSAQIVPNIFHPNLQYRYTPQSMSHLFFQEPHLSLCIERYCRIKNLSYESFLAICAYRVKHNTLILWKYFRWVTMLIATQCLMSANRIILSPLYYCLSYYNFSFFSRQSGFGLPVVTGRSFCWFAIQTISSIGTIVS